LPASAAADDDADEPAEEDDDEDDDEIESSESEVEVFPVVSVAPFEVTDSVPQPARNISSATSAGRERRDTRARVAHGAFPVRRGSATLAW
jgi:hypothetical protein